MPLLARFTAACPAPGTSITTALGLTAGAMAGAAGRASAGLAQPPNAFSARAKPCSAPMSPVSTSTALSGLNQVLCSAARSAGFSLASDPGVPEGEWPKAVPAKTTGAAA